MPLSVRGPARPTGTEAKPTQFSILIFDVEDRSRDIFGRSLIWESNLVFRGIVFVVGLISTACGVALVSSMLRVRDGSMKLIIQGSFAGFSEYIVVEDATQ